MQALEIPGVELATELGRGAHSAVYRGRYNGAPCAVKLPLTRARWTKWIYREAVALARVRNAHLPAVLEVGEIDRLPYLVMELVEGKTLAERIAEAPLDESTVLAIAWQLAEALTAVHEAGLVHRDVKPRNVVIDGENALKLVDFGFTTPMERTGGGETAGTAAYAAPEQMTPPGRVDGRSDLYGLGRVLAECLDPALFAELRREADVDWSARLRSSGVAPGLAAIIGHLTQREPKLRYADAYALLADLTRVERGLLPAGPGEPTHRPTLEVRARRGELDRALDALRGLSAEGKLLLIRGTRGSGKSRLVRALNDALRGTARVASISCTTDDAPLAGLRRVLEAAFVSGDADPHLDGEGKLFENLEAVVDLIAPGLIARVAPRFAAQRAFGEPMPEAQDALAEGVAELFVRMGRRFGRFVVAIDDAQFIDLASAQALVRVAHRLPDASVALVLATRPEDSRGVGERFRALVELDVPVTELFLGTLDEAATGGLVAAHLGAQHVDAVVVARVAAMADGTPLGVLEILGAFLDAGVLRPHQGAWVYDEARLGQLVLPRGALALLGRRLFELPAATQRVLEAAAICGATFRETTIAEMMDLSVETVGYATVSAQRSGVLAPTSDDGVLRFVHDSLRETLLDDLSDAERRRLHQRIAEVTAGRPNVPFEDLCFAARQFAVGEPERNPALVHRVAAAAATEALRRFDEDAALEFFATAQLGARLTGTPIESGLYRVAGEAHLRRGAIDESVSAFQAALKASPDRLARATLHGRIAWCYETHAEPDKAWEALAPAFAEIGERMPVEDVTSAATTTAILARANIDRFFPRPRGRARSEGEIDLLCSLHYQNVRLAFEYGKVGRAIQSSLAGYMLSKQSRSAATKARAQVLYAFVLIALGRTEAGLRDADIAHELAKSSGDQTATAFCTQIKAVARSWGGDVDESIGLFGECVDVFGPWSDVYDYCINTMSIELMQSVRGRLEESWIWSEKALARLRRTPGTPRTALFVVHRARALHATMGRFAQPWSWLAKQLEVTSVDDAGSGFHRILSWGPRAMYLLETDALGEDFERLVADFEAEKHNPRTIHMMATDYYVAVAHARLLQVLRASAQTRPARLAALEHAGDQLRAAARIPLLKAHALVIDGSAAWFAGKRDKALKTIAQAESIARQENCPWVLFAAARVRAHFLRIDGKMEAALDQARVAETLAVEHGAMSRARLIREEFELAPPVAEAKAPSASPKSQRSSSRTNQQLAALLHVARSPRRNLKAEQQAGAILDELIASLKADRGAIWFQPEQPYVGTTTARHRGSVISLAVGPESPRGLLMRSVQRTGEAWPPADIAPEVLDVDPSIDVTRTLVVPLFLYEATVGALALERGSSDPPFATEDRQLLELLSHQVPITLEIARLLFERDQLQTSLQQAQKMEAIGQLAGGLAHDFNNMLAAMRVALGVAQERAGEDSELAAELDIIAQATTRASQLTSQLLTFSRRQPLPVATHDVNQLVVALEPMLRRVAAGQIEVKLNLSPFVDLVSTDSGSFDQALMNLLINARDAMPNGGTFLIATRNVSLDETAAVRANVTPGAYVEIEISDTGEGMSHEIQARIFEPFFTTKPAGRGTGLGLASVYGFVKNCGGGIEVQSEIGQGTTFKLYLRQTERARPPARPPRRARPSSSAAPANGMPDTILVIDDDDLVRRSIAKILERHGYRVIAANGSSEAMDLARAQGKRIGLVIMDVLLPGVTGPELGRRLNDLDVAAKLLFVSGFSAESAPIEDANISSEMLLQKPFSQSALLERVKQLMPSN